MSPKFLSLLFVRSSCVPAFNNPKDEILLPNCLSYWCIEGLRLLNEDVLVKFRLLGLGVPNTLMDLIDGVPRDSNDSSSPTIGISFIDGTLQLLGEKFIPRDSELEEFWLPKRGKVVPVDSFWS